MQILITHWIQRLNHTYPSLNGWNICPFAAKANYKIIQCIHNNINFQRDMKIFNHAAVIIYRMNQTITAKQMEYVCDRFNKKYKKYIFLPDHSQYNTKIKGINTGNMRQNLILCQPRSDLIAARKNLQQKGYYRFWPKQYLKDVWSY